MRASSAWPLLLLQLLAVLQLQLLPLPASAAVPVSSSTAAPAGCSVTLASGTVSVLSSFSFSDTNDALGCLTSDSTTRLQGFAASVGGDIFTFSLAALPSSITPAFIAGTGASGSGYVACQAAADGNFLYLIDTRGKALQRFNPLSTTVAPVVVASFPDETASSLTSLAIDFSARIAYIGTFNTDIIYTVPYSTVGASYSSSSYGQPVNAKVLSLALSLDLKTLYYASPPLAGGLPGAIYSLAVSQGTIPDSSSYSTLLSDTRIFFPDGLLLDPTGTVLYVKDGGPLHAEAGPNAQSTQLLYNISLAVAQPKLNVMLSTTTINLPNGAVVQSTGQNLYFTTSRTLDQISLLPQLEPAPCSSSSAVFSSSPFSSSRISSSAASSSAVSSSRVSSSAVSSSILSSSPLSSSAGSSSVVSSSAASSSAGPSSTSAAAFSDPRFRGFWGQSFYVGGAVGGVYNLLSDAEVQVNAEFVYLRSISCPQVDGRDATNCFQEEGTYFGSISISVQGGHWLRIVGGGMADGFASVQLNDQRAVRVGDSIRQPSVADSFSTRQDGPTLPKVQRLLRGQPELPIREALQGVGEAAAAASTPSSTAPTLSVTRPTARQLRVQASEYALQLDNMDGYVDITALGVRCWACLEQGQMQLDGLLGQTWNASAALKHSEEEVEEFRVQGDDLLGCQHMHDRFCLQA